MYPIYLSTVPCAGYTKVLHSASPVPHSRVSFHHLSFTSLHTGSKQTNCAFLKLTKKQVRKSHNCMLSLYLLTPSPTFAPVSTLPHSCVSARCVLAPGSNFCSHTHFPHLLKLLPHHIFIFPNLAYVCPLAFCHMHCLMDSASKNTSLPYSDPFCIYHSF